jgi:intracellular septation protein
MQLLFDLFPLIAFFLAYKFGGIYVATGVIIAAVVIQAAIQWIQKRKISPMMLTSALLVLVFGGLTIGLKDPNFIKWKPTILYWLFAVTLIGSRFFGEKPLIAHVFGGELKVERAVWNVANNLFALFFAVLGALNLFVAYRYSEETWVTFKFALFGLLAVFSFGMAYWLFSKMPPEQKAEVPDTSNNSSDRPQ